MFFKNTETRLFSLQNIVSSCRESTGRTNMAPFCLGPSVSQTSQAPVRARKLETCVWPVLVPPVFYKSQRPKRYIGNLCSMRQSSHEHSGLVKWWSVQTCIWNSNISQENKTNFNGMNFGDNPTLSHHLLHRNIWDFLNFFWKRAGTFKKYWTGDWMNHLSITVYHGLTSTNQINS